MRVEWRLHDLLEREGITAYRLAKESGISTQNLYPLVRGELTAIRADTLVRVVGALDRLTGTPHSVTDVLEVIRDEPPAASGRWVEA